MVTIQLVSLRNKIFTFSLVACSLLLSSVLTACSTNSSQNQSQAQNATVKNASDNKQMNHGSGMDHDDNIDHNMSMDLGQADASYDLRFIDAMIPHHQGGVEMAKVALQKSQHPEIKKLANAIIKAQSQEIAQMKQWRQAWYPKAGDKPVAYNAEMGHTMEMSAKQMKAMMMSSDLGAADSQFDLRFINAMIPHHQGAVTMAQDALNKSKHPQIKKLSENIISSQQAEIQQMKQWRESWYNK